MEETDFKCEFCDFTSKSYRGINAHMRKHKKPLTEPPTDQKSVSTVMSEKLKRFENDTEYQHEVIKKMAQLKTETIPDNDFGGIKPDGDIDLNNEPSEPRDDDDEPKDDNEASDDEADDDGHSKNWFLKRLATSSWKTTATIGGISESFGTLVGRLRLADVKKNILDRKDKWVPFYMRRYEGYDIDALRSMYKYAKMSEDVDCLLDTIEGCHNSWLDYEDESQMQTPPTPKLTATESKKSSKSSSSEDSEEENPFKALDIRNSPDWKTS